MWELFLLFPAKNLPPQTRWTDTTLQAKANCYQLWSSAMQRKSQKQQNSGPVVAEWAAPQAFWSGQEGPGRDFHLLTMTQVSALTKTWRSGGSCHCVWRERVWLTNEQPLQSHWANRNMWVRQKQTNADTVPVTFGPTFMYAERRLKYWGSGLRIPLPPSSWASVALITTKFTRTSLPCMKTHTPPQSLQEYNQILHFWHIWDRFCHQNLISSTIVF